MLPPPSRPRALATIALPLAALSLASGPAAAQRAIPPAVPSFELPPGEPGVRSVRELRIRGEDALGTDLTVKGYITWIYDCAKQIAKPGQTPAQVQQSIEDDPTQCERPKLYLGATKEASLDRSIWVVEVPRPPRKRELKMLPKDELAKWPAVPKLAVGDYVAVTGTWTTTAPHGDRNSDGLLVYKALAPARPAPPPARPPAASPRPAPPSSPVKPPPAPKPAPVTPAARQESIKRANEGTKAYALRQFATAAHEYGMAIKAWPENSMAWYGLAGAHIAQKQWSDAVSAAARTVAIAPDVATYHVVHGYTLYERAVQQAREAQAAREGRRPEDVVPRPSDIRSDAALPPLVLAAQLDGDLWRAHYYLGRIHRDRGDAAAAAEAFTRAVRRGPPDVAPYVALTELYRRWGYADEALAVAQLGAQTVTDHADRADAYYMLGLAHDDKHEDAAAIDAWTKVLDLDHRHLPSRFMRGQTYLRTKNTAAAKLDLEAVAASPLAGTTASIARQLLFDLAARKRP